MLEGFQLPAVCCPLKPVDISVCNIFKTEPTRNTARVLYAGKRFILYARGVALDTELSLQALRLRDDVFD